MIQSLSDYLNVDPKNFDRLHILNTFVGIDTHVFLDPLILKHTKIPEYVKSRQKI